MVLGQDASVTQGFLRGVVLKLDGTLPIPTGGGSSWLYLFGSAYMRMARNINQNPLILNAVQLSSITPPAPGEPPIPNPLVAVLPLQQPNRDYYRLGVGLNMNQVFCKTFSGTCGSNSGGSNTDTGTSTPTIKTLDPLSASSGASADLTLKVTGTNFVKGSKVQWNGQQLSTSFVSSTEVDATVPKANLAASGTATVIVVNTPGGASAGTTFTIK